MVLRAPRWLLILLLLPLPVHAQQQDQDTTSRFRLGPVGLNPTVAITNVGVDSNVFNDAADPKKDFTATLSPQVDARLRAGRSQTQATGRLDLLYFSKYASERSIDGLVSARVDVPGNRFTPWVNGRFLRGRQRVGNEVDIRARRVERELGLGVDVPTGARSRLSLGIKRVAFSIDADASFLGNNLRESLDRVTDTGGIEFHHALTPLTTLIVGASVVADRFAFATGRDSDSLRVESGFQLAPLALISGEVRVGFRALRSVGGGAPPYNGFVASATAASLLAGRARIEFEGTRDIEYSFDSSFPYYVSTGGTVQLTPRLTDRWDIQLRVGGQRLSYRSLAATEAPLSRVVRLGAGIGYRVGREVRVGFNVDHQRRRTPFLARDYEGYQFGMSATYGS